jgi:hypothetical protein
LELTIVVLWIVAVTVVVELPEPVTNCVTVAFELEFSELIEVVTWLTAEPAMDAVADDKNVLAFPVSTPVNVPVVSGVMVVSMTDGVTCIWLAPVDPVASKLMLPAGADCDDIVVAATAPVDPAASILMFPAGVDCDDTVVAVTAPVAAEDSIVDVVGNNEEVDEVDVRTRADTVVLNPLCLRQCGIRSRP